MRKIIGLLIVLQILALFECLSTPRSSRVGSHAKRQKIKKKTMENVTMKKCDFPLLSTFYCHCRDDDTLVEGTALVCIVFGTLHPNDDRWNQIVTSTSNITKLTLNAHSKYMPMVPNKILREFSSLAVVVLENALLTKLGKNQFLHVPQLQEITFHDCNIEIIEPQTFVNMTKLAVLNFDDNIITVLNRDVFVNLPVLKKLSIQRNYIDLIHDHAFKELTMLKELDLSDNAIADLKNDTFNGLKALERLVLRGNEITTIEHGIFVRMPELRELDLSENNIDYIATNGLDGLGKLWSLNLSENKLFKLETDVFAKTPAINFLDLRVNSLATMTFDDVKPIVTNFYNNSGHLDLRHNQFICDCKLAWIKGLRNETVNEELKNSLDQVTCFFETHNSTQSLGDDEDNRESGVNSTVGDVNKSRLALQEDTNDFTEVDEDDEHDDEDEEYMATDDSTEQSTIETDKMTLVDGRYGYMKYLSQLKVDELPCPEQSRDDPMASEQPLGRRENAAGPSVASIAPLHCAVAFGQCLVILFASLSIF